VKPRLAKDGPLRLLDRSLLALLGGILLQLIPLPAFVVSLISPHRLSYIQQSTLTAGAPAFVPLTLDPGATVHAFLATGCAILTFWTARTMFARGGMRRMVTALAWTAVVFVLVAFAQGSLSPELVYGFWRPYDAGARPLGPVINRNHAGTWSVLALFLCFGCLQWRRSVSSPSRGWSWRARVAHALDGRSLILVLAILLLIVSVASGASRSAMVGLVAAGAFVALVAPPSQDGRRSTMWTGALALAAAFAVIAYADLDRLLSRVEETRSMGLAQRVAIWRDTLGIIRDFPLTGAGAGNFATAMRLYQSTDRMYFWNEAHNGYLQVAAEGGLLLAAPVLVALAALWSAAVRELKRADSVRWMRVGGAAALAGVAVQSIWETGLTLPGNSMLAAAAAAILLHHSRHGSHAATGH
jgi:O-antigen ligase